MANRHLLAVNKLEDFKNWLMENDWKIEETKGNYEVLRARKSTEKLPLIVYKKDRDGLIHLSVSDWNAKYVSDFINSKKNNKESNLQTQLYQQKAIWEKLKEWLKEIKVSSEKQMKEARMNTDYYTRASVQNLAVERVLDKMQELEVEDE